MTYKPGESGNPHGRPKVGLTLAEAIRNKVDPAELVEDLWKRHKKGQLKATEILIERGWGKTPLQLLLTPTSRKYENLDRLNAAELKQLEEISKKLESDGTTDPASDPGGTG